METVNISDAVNMHFIKTTKFKTVTLCLLIRRRLAREEASKNALLANVIRRGCEKYSTLTEMNRELEDMYGAAFNACIVKKGEEQLLQLIIEFADIKGKPGGEDLTRRCLAFIGEVLQNPLTVDNKSFRQDIVSSEIENLKNTIEGRINNKTEYVKLKCLAAMCGNEPFGVYADGYPEDLAGIDGECLYRHYKKILAESPAEFVVIGDVCADGLSAYVKEIFKPFIDGRKAVIQIPLPETGKAGRELRREKEETDVSQGKICIGFKSGIAGNGPDFYKLLLMNEIFGASASSKLFTAVREKESLCYSINSFVYRFKGILFIQCGADTENLEKIFEMSMRELELIRRGNISEKEIANAKKSLSKKFTAIKDSNTGILDFYLSQYLIGDGDGPDAFAEKINRTGIDGCVFAAKQTEADTVYMITNKSK